DKRRDQSGSFTLDGRKETSENNSPGQSSAFLLRGKTRQVVPTSGARNYVDAGRGTTAPGKTKGVGPSTTPAKTLYSEKNLTAEEHRAFTRQQLDLVEQRVQQLKQEIEQNVLLLAGGETGCRIDGKDADQEEILRQKADLLNTSPFLASRFGVCDDPAECLPLGGEWDRGQDNGEEDFVGELQSESSRTGTMSSSSFAENMIAGNLRQSAFDAGDGFFDRVGLEHSFFPRIEARWSGDGEHYSSTGARISDDGEVQRDSAFQAGEGVVDVPTDLRHEKLFDDCVAAQVGRIFVEQFAPTPEKWDEERKKTAAARGERPTATASLQPYVGYASFGFATTGRLVEYPHVDMNLDGTAGTPTEEEESKAVSSFLSNQNAIDEGTSSHLPIFSSDTTREEHEIDKSSVLELAHDHELHQLSRRGGSSGGKDLSTFRSTSRSSTSSATTFVSLGNNKKNFDARTAPWYEATEKRVTKNIVFAIDFSGSMTEHKRWAAVKQAVAQALDTLTTYDRFAIFLWGTMQQLTSLQLVVATEPNVRAAQRWLDDLPDPDESTDAA
ncbi:unnamed protein product, partial [Amoebophrya sp. A120]